MSNLRQAAQAALDALLSCTAVPHWPSLLPAINDLRAALAEAQRERDQWRGVATRLREYADDMRKEYLSVGYLYEEADKIKDALADFDKLNQK